MLDVDKDYWVAMGASRDDYTSYRKEEEVQN